MAENRFTCDCGKHFDNRSDLQKHEKACPVAQRRSQGQSGGPPMTHSAGGSNPPQR